MPEFTVYNTRTGQVRCTGTQATVEWCLAQARPGESVHLGLIPLDMYIHDGAPVTMPPRPSEHHVFDWDTHAWHDPRTLADLQATLKADVAEQRWTLETGGMTLASGVRLKTGREDRAAFAFALADTEAGGLQTLDLKTESGFITLTLEEARAVYSAIAQHVWRCFRAERAALEFIDAITDRGAVTRCSLTDYLDTEAGTVPSVTPSDLPSDTPIA